MANCAKHINIHTPGLCPVCLIEERDRLRKALESVEWITDYDGGCYGAYKECPWCGNSRKEGHAPDCERQRALAEPQ